MIALRAKELERASRTDPSVLDPKELLAMLDCEDWSVRMHVCRMIGRVSWTAEEYLEVRDFAFREAESDNTFVRAWALDALAWLAISDVSVRAAICAMLESAIGAGPASVRVRAREGLKRLGAAPEP